MRSQSVGVHGRSHGIPLDFLRPPQLQPGHSQAHEYLRGQQCNPRKPPCERVLTGTQRDLLSAARAQSTNQSEAVGRRLPFTCPITCG